MSSEDGVSLEDIALTTREKIDKIWTKYVHRGKPTPEQTDEIHERERIPKILRQARKDVAKAIAETLGPDAVLWDDGITIGVGALDNKLASPSDVILKVVNFEGASVGFEVSVQENAIYKVNLNKWRKAFEALGFEYLEQPHNRRLAGNIPKEKYVVDDGTPVFTPEFKIRKSGYITVSVDRKTLLEKIGLPKLNVETLKTGAKLAKAEEIGVNYQKYLIQRGDEVANKGK